MVEQKQIRIADNRMARRGPATSAVALTPKEIYGILRRHILLMIFLTILGLVVGGASWYFLRKYAPRYTARTFIKVLTPTEKDPMTIGGGAMNKNIRYGYRLSLAALIKQQNTLQNLLERDKIQETKWFKRFGEIKAKRIARALRDLNSHFGAHAQKDAEFITLSMTCGDKGEAALVVNTMVDLFLASQGSTKREEIAEKLARLEEQRIRVQRDLDSTEKALDEVRRRWGFSDLGDREFQHTVTTKLNDLELEQNELIMTMKQLQANIENLARQATGPINEQTERQVERDPTVNMLTQRIVAQEIQLMGILTKFGENHRIVREIREQMATIEEEKRLRKAEIAEQTRQSNLQDARDQLIVLQSRFEELERIRQETAAKQKDLDSARQQFDQRVAIKDERQRTLNQVKNQIEKLKIMHDDPETPKVQFVGYAPKPIGISSPKWQFYFPGGTMLGFILGIGFAFLIELLNDLVRTPKDIGKYLHIPLLGVIPDAAEDEQVMDIDLCQTVRQAPYSIISESYRRFRTNLKLSVSAESSKVLLIGSGMAGDGKTAVATNLAMTFVAENKKVLLIDANFRRPTLHTIFPEATAESAASEWSKFGLSDLLMGQCGYQEVIRSSGVDGLYVIESGQLPSTPAELLGGAQMEQLIKQLRDNYDYVIIDGPPVLLVSDAKVLTRLVDSMVLVFNAGTTRRGIAQRTIRELRDVNASIIGCVLFAVKALKGGYFHEQFRSYHEYQKMQPASGVN